jgi:hypothetical protein
MSYFPVAGNPNAAVGGATLAPGANLDAIAAQQKSRLSTPLNYGVGQGIPLDRFRRLASGLGPRPAVTTSPESPMDFVRRNGGGGGGYSSSGLTSPLPIDATADPANASPNANPHMGMLDPSFFPGNFGTDFNQREANAAPGAFGKPDSPLNVRGFWTGGETLPGELAMVGEKAPELVQGQSDGSVKVIPLPGSNSSLSVPDAPMSAVDRLAEMNRMGATGPLAPGGPTLYDNYAKVKAEREAAVAQNLPDLGDGQTSAANLPPGTLPGESSSAPPAPVSTPLPGEPAPQAAAAAPFSTTLTYSPEQQALLQRGQQYLADFMQPTPAPASAPSAFPGEAAAPTPQAAPAAAPAAAPPGQIPPAQAAANAGNPFAAAPPRNWHDSNTSVLDRFKGATNDARVTRDLRRYLRGDPRGTAGTLALLNLELGREGAQNTRAFEWQKFLMEHGQKGEQHAAQWQHWSNTEAERNRHNSTLETAKTAADQAKTAAKARETSIASYDAHTMIDNRLAHTKDPAERAYLQGLHGLNSPKAIDAELKAYDAQKKDNVKPQFEEDPVTHKRFAYGAHMQPSGSATDTGQTLTPSQAATQLAHVREYFFKTDEKDTAQRAQLQEEMDHLRAIAYPRLGATTRAKPGGAQSYLDKAKQ